MPQKANLEANSTPGFRCYFPWVPLSRKPQIPLQGVLQLGEAQYKIQWPSSSPQLLYHTTYIYSTYSVPTPKPSFRGGNAGILLIEGNPGWKDMIKFTLCSLKLWVICFIPSHLTILDLNFCISCIPNSSQNSGHFPGIRCTLAAKSAMDGKGAAVGIQGAKHTKGRVHQLTYISLVLWSWCSMN